MAGFFGAPTKALLGLHQIIKASKGLKDANKLPDAQYVDPLQVRQNLEQSIQEGFTPEQTTAFNTQLTRLNNQRYKLASDVNPNLGNQIISGINYGNIQALNDFSAENSRIREGKINSLVGSTIAQSNRNTMDANERKRRLQEEYAEAKMAGITNVMGYFDQLDRDATSVTSMVAGGGLPMGGGGATSGAGGTGSSLGGQAPLRSLANPAPMPAGTDQWAQDLYGDPMAQYRSGVQPPAVPGPVGFYNAPANPLYPNLSYR